VAAFEDEIRQTLEPDARARTAQYFIGRVTASVAEAREIRDAAVLELWAAGWSQLKIADLLGVKQATVSRIVSPPKKPIE
jgi:DNA-binding NarL/FixJ family response regulator